MVAAVKAAAQKPIRTIGSLFSGVGMIELGLIWAMPWARVSWQVEIDPFCRSVLERRFPMARKFENVQYLNTCILERVDLVCGGFPCQDVSAAGSGDGLAGARSGLWGEFARVLEGFKNEGRSPRFVLVENVASGAKRWVDPVVRKLGRLGYEALPVPLAAVDAGAPHLRRRVFVVARLATDAHGEPVRFPQQRGSEGRPGGVCDQGEPESRNDGAKGAPPDANRGRCSGERQPADGEQLSETGSEPDGCGGAQKDDQREPWRPHGWWASGPRFHGVAHGPSRRVDRDRLKAHGNGAVPQNVQVVGEIFNLWAEQGF